MLRISLMALLAAAAGPTALAQTSGQLDPVGPDAETMDTAIDRHDRMTIPVTIGGGGPYAFVVDTGSERTAISRELADRLGLADAGTATVHGMTGPRTVAMANIPALSVSSEALRGIRAPTFLQSNLGADGLLGIDSLRTKRVMLDFKNQKLSVEPSVKRKRLPVDANTIVVEGKSKLGQLVLVDSTANGKRLWVIIDTGSQVSVGNHALRRQLRGLRKPKGSREIELLSVTGTSMMAEYTRIGEVRIGGVTMIGLPVAFADAHPFKILGLTDRPALLLGMDALGAFDRVSVDFPNDKVSFRLRSDAGRRSLIETGPGGGSRLPS